MYTTKGNPTISEEDRRIVSGIAPIVEKQLESIGREEYLGKFEIERYMEINWYLRPKSSMFSRGKGYLVKIEFRKNYHNFNDKYYLVVDFRDHPNGESPGDQRVKDFCYALTEATGLNIIGFRNNKELFWGTAAHPF